MMKEIVLDKTLDIITVNQIEDSNKVVILLQCTNNSIYLLKYEPLGFVFKPITDFNSGHLGYFKAHTVAITAAMKISSTRIVLCFDSLVEACEWILKNK